MQPVILTEHNIDILNNLLNQFIDEVKGQIEAWSERGSGWILDKILEAFINVARYRPMRGGSYMPLPTKLKNKKAVLNIQNRDNQCLGWAIHAALFQPRGHMRRPSSYPAEDGLDFRGIHFPTPVSQIDRLDNQNENLAINVFGWEGRVVVHRISEKGGEIPRINLMLTTQGENTHYSLVKRLTALLYDQNRHNESKHFCERCLHGYSRRDLLERHKPECKGLLKTPTRTETPKQDENKMSFKNFQKQMKAPYVVYKFLTSLMAHEEKMREDMANKKPLTITKEDRKNHKSAAECHICSKSLYKDLYLDSMEVYDPDSEPQKMLPPGSKQQIRNA